MLHVNNFIILKVHEVIVTELTKIMILMSSVLFSFLMLISIMVMINCVFEKFYRVCIIFLCVALILIRGYIMIFQYF